MDHRDYLGLEAGLAAKVISPWTSYAAEQYAALSKAVAARDWATAYGIANELDLTDVVSVQAPYVRAYLHSSAIFGAKMAGSGKALAVGTVEFGKTMDHVVTGFMTAVEWGVTKAVRDAATQSIAEAQAAYQKTQKADTPRFLEEFVSFKQNGDAALQLVSSLHTSRLSTWGFTAEAEFLGVTKYELSAVLDGRTSRFCRLVNGKVFEVAAARESILSVLAVQDPQDLKTLQPWPKQNKDAIEAFSTMSPEELTKQGLHIPPFHPYCRTMLVLAGKAPRIAKPKITKPVPSQVLPEVQSSPEDFKALGLSIGPDQVDHWNTFVGLSPVEVLSKLSGYSPTEVVAGALGKRYRSVYFADNGDIRFRFKANIGDKSNTKMTFNPYSGVLYQNQMDFLAAEVIDSYRFFRQLEASKVVLGSSLGAVEVVTSIGFGQAVAYGKLGYLPTEESWAFIRQTILEDIKVALGPQFSKLSKKRQQLIMLCLTSNDPRAFRALADLKEPFVKKLFSGVAFQGHLDLTDPDTLLKHAKGAQ